LRAFLAALKIVRFHLVGLSMGGTTAIGYALKFGNQLKSLTLVSTAAAGWMASKKISMVDRLALEKGLEVARRKWKQITLLYYKDEHRDIKQSIEMMIDDHSGAIWLDPMRGKYPREYDLEKVHQITVPTMIMTGARDSIFVPLANNLYERIPESRLLVYENTGHMLNMEQPDRFNDDLEAFLKRVESPE
jgi:3-oxoadipate enol-lactonase/2-succinyl-6-hydroxy-2,4-cyclohexadiene-1-carboxylate synthase